MTPSEFENLFDEELYKIIHPASNGRLPNLSDEDRKLADAIADKVLESSTTILFGLLALEKRLEREFIARDVGEYAFQGIEVTLQILWDAAVENERTDEAKRLVGL